MTWSRSSLADRRYHAVDALEAVDVDYEPLPAVVDMEAALADGSPLVHADKGTNKCYYWEFTGGDYAAAAAKAEVVVKRRFIQQRLIPTAMEPALGRVLPRWARAARSRCGRPPRSRTSSACCSRCRPGSPSSRSGSIAPDVGGGFGSKLAALPRGGPRRAAGPASWAARSSGPSRAARTTCRHHHGRDQIQDIEVAATRDGTILGLKVDLHGRHGRLPADHHAGHPAARGVHVQRHLQDGGATTSAAPACSPPRRRPTPTAAPDGRRRPSPSSGSSTSWPPSWAWSRSSCARRTGSSTRSSRTPPIAGLEYDTRQLRGGDRPGQGAVRLRRAARRAAGAARAAATRSSWASASRRSPRCAAWRRPASWARSSTSRAAGSTARSGCCPPARSSWSPARQPARPGARHGVEPDRRRRPRGAVRGHRGHPRRHPVVRPTAWTPTARGRSRSGASRCSGRPSGSSRRPG